MVLELAGWVVPIRGDSMAKALGEALGAIGAFALVYAGSAIAVGGFIGIASGIAMRVFNLF